jgi:hypothetical protein
LFEQEPEIPAPANAYAVEQGNDEPIPLAGAGEEEADEQDREELDGPQLHVAAPIVAPIDEAELDLISPPKEPESPDEEMDGEPAAPVIDEATHPSTPEPSEPHAPSVGEEKLTELLGELVETVAKVQSTWEEMKSGSEQMPVTNHVEEHGHHPHEVSMD